MSKYKERLPTFASVSPLFSNLPESPMRLPITSPQPKVIAADPNYDAELECFAKLRKEAMAKFAVKFPAGATLSVESEFLT